MCQVPNNIAFVSFRKIGQDTSAAYVSIPRNIPLTWRLKQNGGRFADDIFNFIFSHEKDYISIQIFVSNGPISNKPVLDQIMAWRRAGDMLLCETMMV